MTRCLLLVLAGATTALAGGDFPYLYQRTGFATGGAVSVEVESALGTRDAAPFGSDGFEQGARARYGVSERLTLETWAGTLFHEGGQANGAALEAFWGAASARGLDVTLGAGVARDFREDTVLRLRTSVARASGRLDTQLLARAEVPLASDRDKVDFIFGAASSVALSNGAARLGVEVMGEDLEGFWDPHEAEGGARLVAGPTVWLDVPGPWELKANVAGVLQATRNPYVDPSSGRLVEPEGSGVLARMAVNFDF